MNKLTCPKCGNECVTIKTDYLKDDVYRHVRAHPEKYGAFSNVVIPEKIARCNICQINWSNDAVPLPAAC